MDRVPSGVPPGADGAFERFLTAALATIITIMFSWRLLAEEEEAVGGHQHPTTGSNRAQTSIAFPALRQSAKVETPQQRNVNTGDNMRQLNRSGLLINNINPASIIHDISIDETNTISSRRNVSNVIDREVQESVLSDHFEPIYATKSEQYPDINVTASGDMSFSDDGGHSGEETLTTWDEYKWEEELGEEHESVIKTNRSVRDFLTSPKRSEVEMSAPNHNSDGSKNEASMDDRIQNVGSENCLAVTSSTSSTGSPSLTFAQRFANFEYKDCGGDSGYIDLYPDVDSDDNTESSDDDNVYEIQLSDSDSDSGDERAGMTFFGVTALDTIMEEIECDAIEEDEDEKLGNCGDVVDVEFGRNELIATVKNLPSNVKSAAFEKLESVPITDGNKLKYHSLDVDEAIVLDINQPESISLSQSVGRVESGCEMLHGNGYTEPAISSTDSALSCPIEPSHTERGKQRDHYIPHTIDDNPICPISTTHLRVEGSVTECDATVVNIHVPVTSLEGQQASGAILENNNNTTDNTCTRNINTDSQAIRMLQNTYPRSKDSSLNDAPQSPVRTCALDNIDSLADDQFSDTESCAESVITVLSMKSTDSDNYTPDQYDVASGLVTSGQPDTARGRNDRLLLSDDRYSGYEQGSLVSGFLNDSLNSLLSSKTSESDHSRSDLDTETGVQRNKSSESLTEINVNNFEQETYIQTQLQNHLFENGSIKDSSSESLPPVLDSQNSSFINENNVTVNGYEYNDSNQVINIEPSESLSVQHEINYSDVIGDYIDSDSDGSDPPLREYDPDDDDLAAFQFNHDGDDDSFYLLVGDEGSLRNFETFTNLNSVGLNEYSDAVPSLTSFEDAHSFTFSRTEQVDTQFRNREYFTDRNTSDSDAHGDSVLSPIQSEDEEISTFENANVDKSPVSKNTAYDDAELSSITQPTVDNSTDSYLQDRIDFHKYIIPSQMESSCYSSQKGGVKDLESANKKQDGINTHTNINVSGRSINEEAIKDDTVGVNFINNEESGQLRTCLDSLVHEAGIEQTRESKKETSADIQVQLNEVNVSLPTKENVKNENVLEIDKLKNESAQNKHQINSPVKSERNIHDSCEQKGSNEIKNNETDNKKLNEVEKSSPVQSATKAGIKSVTRGRSSSFTRVTQTQSKVETNIDDIFVGDDSKEQDAHSSNDKKLKTIENEIALQAKKADKVPTKRRQIKRNNAVETCIDDFITPDSRSDKQHERTENRLSYDSFVDELVGSKSSPDCSENVQSVLTSESGKDDKSKVKSIHDSGVCKSENAKNSSPRILQSRSSFGGEVSSSVNIDKSKTRNSEVKPNYSTPHDIDKRIQQSNTDRVTLDNTNEHSSQKDKAEKEQKARKNKSKTEQLSPIINTPSDGKVSNAANGQPSISVNKNKQLNKPDYNGNITVPKIGILNTPVNNKHSSGSSPKEDNRRQGSYLGTDSQSSSREKDIKGTPSDILDYKSPLSPKNEFNIIVEEKCDSRSPSSKSYREYNQYDSLETSSIGSCSLTSDDESLNSFSESYSNLQNSYNESRRRGHSDSSLGRVVRTSNTKPSELFAHNKSKKKDLKGVQKRIQQHQWKKYTSVLQSPIKPEKANVKTTAPEVKTPLSRLKVRQQRQRFLSSENISDGSFEERFLQHRTSLVSSTPRKYIKRRDRIKSPDTHSTESLPSMFSYLYSGYGSNTSMDRIHSLPLPRNIEELYASRSESANTSYEKPDYHSLHENCIFSPEKRAELTHTTQSLENMFEQLLQYGSIHSVAETDIDAVHVTDQHNNSFHDSYISDYDSFQYPLERAASMSALTATSDGQRLPRKPGKGRFASRNVTKSKSLQTLETNLDDVFADEEAELSGGGLRKTPSVHELRVSKSLTKLSVPDWFKKSSFSRSDSTQSLFTYARQGSTSTLGSCAYPSSITTSPSVTPNRGAIIIQKRVTPSPTVTSQSARLVRAPLLPSTPEKAPIPLTSASLPSDKYRTEAKKELKPIPIVPFAKIREMFERKAQADAAARKNSLTSPTKERPPSNLNLSPAVSPTKEPNPILKSPSREATITTRVNEPVQNETLERKSCIVPESARRSGSELQKSGSGRRMQVHFSDEKDVSKTVSKPVDKNSNSETLRQNGTNSVQPDKKVSPSSGKSTNPKSQSLRVSLPKPQFRFRRPGIFATKPATQPQPAATTAQNTNTQSKKETTV